MNAIFVILGSILGSGLLCVGFWFGWKVRAAVGRPEIEHPGLLATKIEDMRAAALSEVDLAGKEAEEQGWDYPYTPGENAPDY